MTPKQQAAEIQSITRRLAAGARSATDRKVVADVFDRVLSLLRQEAPATPAKWPRSALQRRMLQIFSHAGMNLDGLFLDIENHPRRTELEPKMVESVIATARDEMSWLAELSGVTWPAPTDAQLSECFDAWRPSRTQPRGRPRKGESATGRDLVTFDLLSSMGLIDSLPWSTSKASRAAAARTAIVRFLPNRRRVPSEKAQLAEIKAALLELDAARSAGGRKRKSNKKH